jgi:hypothetical protein
MKKVRCVTSGVVAREAGRDAENPAGACCAYDEWFSAETTDAASRAAFDAVLRFVENNYAGTMHADDVARADHVAERGNAAVKLAFVLMAQTHERAIRDQIAAGVAGTAPAEKMAAFRRLLSVATRSALETPFTERNSPALIGRYLQVAHLGWVSMDRRSLSNFCDFFCARTRSSCDVYDPPPMAEAGDFEAVARARAHEEARSRSRKRKMGECDGGDVKRAHT